MTRLRVTTKPESRLMSFNLPSDLRSFLTLYALGTNTNKSKILRKITNDWYLEALTKEDMLINNIAKNIYTAWEKHNLFTSDPLSDYMNYVRVELESKKIEPRIVSLIIRKVYETNEQKTKHSSKKTNQ